MKRSLILLISLLTSIAMTAEGISRNAALLKAQQFMPNKHFTEEPTTFSVKAREGNNNQAFYVFNAEGNDGFVIVSGDDRTTPILGYGEQGNLDLSQIPENMKWWLEGYVQQIETLGERLTPVVKTANMSQAAAISPLILSKWNQYTPYNYMCPDGNYVDYYEYGYNTGNRCITGCVATAMAQVMNYWQWPETCPAIESYEYNGHIIKGLPATTFDWGVTSNTYTRDETGVAANAVAKLMRYCGQAVKMGYTPSLSGAYLSPEAMVSIFQYSPNCYELYRDNYSIDAWEALIYNELAEERPVFYSGSSYDSGHQFIIDGYDGNGLFHINWGWGGSYDAYCVLSLADPNDGRGGYEYDQRAILGMQPAQPGEIMKPAMRSNVSEGLTTKTYDRLSSNKNFSDVNLNGFIYANYILQPESTMSAEIGWGIYKDGVLLQIISSKNITIKQDTWSYYDNTETVSFGAGLAEGTYQLNQVYRFTGETEWKQCLLNSLTLVAEVTATSMTVKLPNASNMSFRVNSISLPEEPMVGEEATFSVNITNTGETSRLNVGLWLQKQGETTWTNVAVKTYYADLGKSVDLPIPYTPEEAGTFNIKITAGSDETALKTGIVKIAATEVITLNGITYRCIPEYKRASIIHSDNADNRISEITIPSTVTASGVECKVVNIDEDAFFNYYNIKTLIIPEGVERIGRFAFEYMSSLTKLTLPSTLKEIDEYVINWNNNLETVESKATNPINVSENAFVQRSWNTDTQQYDYYNSPATLYVPIGSKTKYEAIPGWTKFAAIEEGEIKEAMIAELRYRYSTSGNTATVIADDSYTELTSVTIPATIIIGGKTYKVTAVGSRAFYYCWNINTLTLPEGLETIGNYAFYDTGISELTLPSTLKEIGEFAFIYCSNIKTLIIPEGVERIGEYAFANMSSLTKLTLPSTLKEIGEYVINGNSNLEAVESKAINPINVSENTFIQRSWNIDTQQYDYYNSPATLYVPFGSKTKYKAIPGWTKFAAIEEGEIKEAMIAELRYRYSTGGNTATVIADDSYTELTSVTIPATIIIGGKTYKVTAVGSRAFYYCWNINTLTLPEGLETIGNYAFYDTGISELTLPSTLKEIGESAFYYCFNVKTLIIPEGVKRIGEYAFADMIRLTKLTLPSTLKEIGEYVINGDSNMETVDSKATNPINVSENAFIQSSWNRDTQQYDYYNSPATLYVPFGSKEKYTAIPGWTKFAAIEEKSIADFIHTNIVSENGSKVKAYFNMNGQPIPAPQKGINIIKYSDGSTEKVIIK